MTAAHGTIERMRNDDTGQARAAHAMSQVPLAYACGDKPLADGGSLSDPAPTILGIPQSVEMTGRSLLTAH